MKARGAWFPGGAASTRRGQPALQTGYGLEEDLRKLREGGILDVVHKPFDVGALEAVIRRAFNVLSLTIGHETQV
ncbi:MAG: hypothetical protein H8E90_09065 [Anaerolineales bacterium]|nr:hypothetical protein [Anaerolineales bacterium]